MKTISLREFQLKAKSYLDYNEEIILTRRKHVIAKVIPLEALKDSVITKEKVESMPSTSTPKEVANTPTTNSFEICEKHKGFKSSCGCE